MAKMAMAQRLGMGVLARAGAKRGQRLAIDRVTPNYPQHSSTTHGLVFSGETADNRSGEVWMTWRVRPSRCRLGILSGRLPGREAPA